MTLKEAKKIAQEFENKQNPTEEDEFLFIEALEYIIEKEKDPGFMMWLGGHYYEKKRFDLALKYYEMAATYDYDEAYECLGYVWYYGRTGERDFKKAFEYFSRLMKKGHLVATYKVADMYKNGYYVEKNQAKYEQIIEELYPEVEFCNDVFDPVPEVYTRLAAIRRDQGRADEAIELYENAKEVLAERLKYNAFFGNLNIMKWLIDDIYQLKPFNYDNIDLYDLYYLLKTPNKIRMHFVLDPEDKHLEVESVQEGDVCEVCFNGKWFHDRDDFFSRAVYGDYSIKQSGDMFNDIKVVK